MKKTMKVWMLLCCLLSVNLYAQETGEGIRFVEGKTFEEVLVQAKQEKKMVFVDCYTSWCGPCKMMSKNVFPQKVAGDFFNKEFVSVKIDMEKGEGPQLMKRFGVNAFPTLIFFDANGKEINRIVGAASSAEEFVKNVKSGLGANSLSAMTERYQAGERGEEFLLQYLDVLGRANKRADGYEVAEIVLKGREAELLDNPRLFSVLMRYNVSPMTPAFQYVADHQAEFEAKYPKAQMERWMSMMWMAYPRTLITDNSGEPATFDHEAMEAYKKELKRRNIENREEIILLSDMNVAQTVEKDWKKYAKLGSKYIKKYGEKDMYIYNWALQIQRGCTDKKVQATAVKWMENRIKNIEAEQANLPPLPEGVVRPMPMMNYVKSYQKMIEEMK